MLVPEVNKEEAGYRSGLRTGDVILSINGDKLSGGKRSVDKVVNTIRGTQKNSELIMTISRTGTTDPFPLKVCLFVCLLACLPACLPVYIYMRDSARV